MDGNGTGELYVMTVAEIKQAILSLPKFEYAELIHWLNELEWDEWDRQIKADSVAGKLDVLKERALKAKK